MQLNLRTISNQSLNFLSNNYHVHAMLWSSMELPFNTNKGKCKRTPAKSYEYLQTLYLKQYWILYKLSDAFYRLAICVFILEILIFLNINFHKSQVVLNNPFLNFWISLFFCCEIWCPYCHRGNHPKSRGHLKPNLSGWNIAEKTKMV